MSGNVTMLWLDDSGESLETRLQKALVYFQEKYGQAPKAAYIPTAEFTEAGGLLGQFLEVSGIAVWPSKMVQPHHMSLEFVDDRP